jgi:hypothetical protein
VYRRTSHTIEKVMEIVENVEEALNEDMVHSSVSIV